MMIIGLKHRAKKWAPVFCLQRCENKKCYLPQLFHHFIRDLVIAPDGLDVVVIVEHVDQLQQRPRIVLADNRLDPRFPAQLDRFGLAQHLFEFARHRVQHVTGGPDRVPSSSRSTSSAPASIAASSTFSSSPALALYSIRPSRSKPWL